MKLGVSGLAAGRKEIYLLVRFDRADQLSGELNFPTQHPGITLFRSARQSSLDAGQHVVGALQCTPKKVDLLAKTVGDGAIARADLLEDGPGGIIVRVPFQPENHFGVEGQPGFSSDAFDFRVQGFRQAQRGFD